jgi:hypothetical protein
LAIRIYGLYCIDLSLCRQGKEKSASFYSWWMDWRKYSIRFNEND